MADRLISADALKDEINRWRRDLIEAYDLDDICNTCFREVYELIDNAPTVEAVPKEDYMALRIASQKVVDNIRKRLGEIEERLNAIDIHCIDCKHHKDEEPGMVYCPNIVGGWVSNNFYCGDAERKGSEVYCDRNLCAQNEYNGIECDECQEKRRGEVKE